MATAGRDFFRIDRSGPTKRLLALAGLLVTAGATAIGAHLVSRLAPDVGHFVSLGGGLTVVVGLILGFGAMAMLVFENVYLLLREEGVVCHDNGKETTIPWSELESVRLDEGYVVLERKGGEALRWFAGKAAKQIHGCIEEAKRKALHGLLKDSN
jgi:hypothetical protein